MKTPIILCLVVLVLLVAQRFLRQESHEGEGDDIQASLHEILASQYRIDNFARFMAAEEEILSGYTKNNPFEVLTYLCRNSINIMDAGPRFYHKIFLACKSVEEYERFLETVLSARYLTVRFHLLRFLPVYDLTAERKTMFLRAVINVLHNKTIRDEGELVCLRLLVRYFENPVVEKWWRDTSANAASHYHLDAVLAMVTLYSWEDSRDFAVNQLLESKDDVDFVHHVLWGLKLRIVRFAEMEDPKTELDIPAEDLNQIIEIIINDDTQGYFGAEMTRLLALSSLYRGLYIERGGENTNELLLILFGLTDNPQYKERLLNRYIEVTPPKAIMREYQHGEYPEILYSASFLELFNQKLRENRKKNRFLDSDFIPVLLNEISDRADDENGLMEVLKSFEELLETEQRFRQR